MPDDEDERTEVPRGGGPGSRSAMISLQPCGAHRHDSCCMPSCNVVYLITRHMSYDSHAVSYHLTAPPLHDMLRHVLSRSAVVLVHAMSCHPAPHHVKSRHATPHHVTSSHVMSRQVMSRSIMPRHAKSRHVTSRHVM